jgi:hypothetical protein
MNTSLSPALTTLCCVGLLAAVLMLLMAFQARYRKRLILATTAVLLILPSGFFAAALNPWLTDSRFRAYRSFYREIEVGMTKEDVIGIMAQHYPAGGVRQRPTIMEDSGERLGFFMAPEQSTEPNCEGIFLAMHDGKVSSKGYSPD